MLLSRNKKNNVYPCKPQFYAIKVGFKGVNIIQACFLDVKLNVRKNVSKNSFCRFDKSTIKMLSKRHKRQT